MNHARRLHIRRWIIAGLVGAISLPVMWGISPLAAEAKTKCTNRVTGAHNGTINVAAGEVWCLKKAAQTGDINVASGGALKVKKSTVNGGINLNSGFTMFKFCASKQQGGSAVNVTGGTKKVLMGGTDKCRGNDFSGALNLTSNNTPVKLGKNTIAGVLTIATNPMGNATSGNTIGGAVNISGNSVKTLLSGNDITGALSCSANDPDPTNGGHRNSVTGARSGETCAPANF